jgi:hypothetical protein
MRDDAELREFMLNPLVAASIRKDVARRVINGCGGAPLAPAQANGGEPEKPAGGEPDKPAGAGGEPAKPADGCYGDQAKSAGGERGQAPGNGQGQASGYGGGAPPAPAQANGGEQARSASGGRDSAFVRFVCLLIDKNRLPELSGIAEDYSLLKSEARNELRATLYSRQALEPAQLGALSRKYAERYGAASVLIENIVDESLLGGIIAQIGDVRVDASLSGRLAALGRAISR